MKAFLSHKFIFCIICTSGVYYNTHAHKYILHVVENVFSFTDQKPITAPNKILTRWFDNNVKIYMLGIYIDIYDAFQLIYKFPQCSGKLRFLFYIESRVYDLHHNIKIVISLLLMVQQN